MLILNIRALHCDILIVLGIDGYGPFISEKDKRHFFITFYESSRDYKSRIFNEISLNIIISVHYVASEYQAFMHIKMCLIQAHN